MRTQLLCLGLACLLLGCVTLPAHAQTRPDDCTHLFTVSDFDAIITRTIGARDAAYRTLDDDGALHSEIERLIRHLDLAITGAPDASLDGLEELSRFHAAHPRSPGHLFGGVHAVLGRLQTASQIAANVAAGRGPGIPIAPRWDTWHRTTLAFEQLAALWRPVAQCKIELYL